MSIFNRKYISQWKIVIYFFLGIGVNFLESKLMMRSPFTQFNNHENSLAAFGSQLPSMELAALIIFLIRAGCLTVTWVWLEDGLPPFRDLPYPPWTYVIFSLTAPAYTVIYGLLTFWVICSYLEEMETTGTDLLEAVIAIIGFFAFFVITLIIGSFSYEDEYHNRSVALLFCNMSLAVVMMAVFIILTVIWNNRRKARGSSETRR